MYLAGAEDGHIYKCSTSYSEQYLEAYNGHIGPVYQVQWSPFRSDLFISCSADWSIKLWAEGKVSASSTLCCNCCTLSLEVTVPDSCNLFPAVCCLS